VTSKTAILQAVRQARGSASHLPDAGLPDLAGPWISYDDPLAQFVSVLESVGGRAIIAANIKEANGLLAEIAAYAEARTVISLVPNLGQTPKTGQTMVTLDAIDDPHELENVDFAVLPGRFAVCENGAVWVDDAALKHRVLYFVAQHLVLVVAKSELVHNMHAAYERLRFEQPGFGAFVSGPSKTADIEQSLVIGAHGPRSMTVFLIE